MLVGSEPVGFGFGFVKLKSEQPVNFAFSPYIVLCHSPLATGIGIIAALAFF